MATRSHRQRFDRKSMQQHARLVDRISIREPEDEDLCVSQLIEHFRFSPDSLSPKDLFYSLQSASYPSRTSEDLPEIPECADEIRPVNLPDRKRPPRSLPSPTPALSLASSKTSLRRSELSYGILDYYLQIPRTPELGLEYSAMALSPRLVQSSMTYSRPESGVIDPAMKKFDFGVPSPPPPAGLNDTAASPATMSRKNNIDAAGSDIVQHPSHTDGPVTPPEAKTPRSSRSKPDMRRTVTYSLFPSVDATTTPAPTSRPTTRPAPQGRSHSLPTDVQPTSTEPQSFDEISEMITNPQWNPSYRPRKESVAGGSVCSLKERKDSCMSASIGTNSRTKGFTTMCTPSHASNASIGPAPPASTADPSSPPTFTTPDWQVRHRSTSSSCYSTHTSGSRPATSYNHDRNDSNATQRPNTSYSSRRSRSQTHKSPPPSEPSSPQPPFNLHSRYEEDLSSIKTITPPAAAPLLGPRSSSLHTVLIDSPSAGAGAGTSSYPACFFEDDDDDDDEGAGETSPLRRRLEAVWRMTTKKSGNKGPRPGSGESESTAVTAASSQMGSTSGLVGNTNGASAHRRGRGESRSGWGSVGRALLCGGSCWGDGRE